MVVAVTLGEALRRVDAASTGVTGVGRAGVLITAVCSRRALWRKRATAVGAAGVRGTRVAVVTITISRT